MADFEPGESRDQYRVRGTQLRMMHLEDAIEEIELLEWELEKKEEAAADAERYGEEEERAWLEDQIEIITDSIDGLLKGELRAPVPRYDSRDAQATKMGEENAIAWVRKEERRVKQDKRLRRIKCLQLA
jgi:hypothetical protein